MIDVREIVDFVLKYTKQQKLVYVGHSQGTTLAFSLLAEPDFSSKISLYAGMSLC